MKITITMKLGEIIKSSHLIDLFGINPWCVNEGADPETEYCYNKRVSHRDGMDILAMVEDMEESVD